MNLYNFIVEKFQSSLRNLHINWRHRITYPFIFSFTGVSAVRGTRAMEVGV